MLRIDRPILKQGPALATAVIIAGLLMTAGCSINVKDNEAGENKKVDIDTPIGGIHVDQTADASDTGMAVYPGSRVEQDHDNHDNQNANVNLSAFGFGLKVAAVQYRSDDPPAKVIDFYRGQLKKFGDVLECHTSGHKNVSYSHRDSGSKELSCEGDSGSTLELKSGNEDNQHIVSIESNGKGSKFALVHVQMRGKDTI